MPDNNMCHTQCVPLAKWFRQELSLSYWLNSIISVGCCIDLNQSLDGFKVDLCAVVGAESGSSSELLMVQLDTCCRCAVVRLSPAAVYTVHMLSVLLGHYRLVSPHTESPTVIDAKKWRQIEFHQLLIS
jgi:hypothetical protein